MKERRDRDTTDRVMSDTRAGIIAAAVEVISEKTILNTHMCIIAKRARVSVGSIYRYFKNKEELINVIHHQITALLGENNRLLEGKASPREQFASWCMEVLCWLRKHPKQLKFLVQYYSSPYGSNARQNWFNGGSDDASGKDPFREFLETARAERIIKNLPIEVLRALTLGSMILMLQNDCGDMMENEDVLERTVAALWDALRTENGGTIKC